MDLTAARRYLQEREDIAFAYLFGSTATGKATPLSDLDIAVYLTGGCFPQKRLELIGDLCDRLGTDRPIS
jgi:predicted nucleotidyltransferase